MSDASDKPTADREDAGRAAGSGTPDSPNTNRQGVGEDERKQSDWIEKAAAQGNPDAQVMLQAMRVRSVLLPKDEKDAFAWLEKAAAQGNADAQFLLRSMDIRKVSGSSNEANSFDVKEKPGAQARRRRFADTRAIRRDSTPESATPIFFFAGLAFIVLIFITGPFATNFRRDYDEGGSWFEFLPRLSSEQAEQNRQRLNLVVAVNRLLAIGGCILVVRSCVQAVRRLNG